MRFRARLGLLFVAGMVPAVLVPAGCGGDDASQPVTADGGDASVLVEASVDDAADASADTAPPGIRGTITVHGSNVKGRVFLGDGSKFNAPIDRNGVVTFTDPSIVGPQNVTYTTDPALGGLIVFTLAKIDAPEVWLDTTGGVDTTDLASANGTLSYPADPKIDRIDLTSTGKGIYGFNQTSGPFPFNLSVHGPRTTTTFGVLGFASNQTDQKLRCAGFLPAIPVPPNATDAAAPDVTLPNLDLDHPFNQPVAFTVTNHALYGPNLVASIHFMVGGVDLMSNTERLPGPTVSVNSLAMTPPFDTFERFVDLAVEGAEGSQARIFVPVGAKETSVTANTVPLPTVAEPATSPVSAPDPLTPIPFAPGAAVTFTSGDPNAQVVDIDVSSRGPVPTDGGSGFYFYWTVHVPKGETGFTFFELPANASPVRFFPKGNASLRLTTTAYSKATLSEVYGKDVATIRQIRNTRGSVEAHLSRRFAIQ